MTIIFVPGCLLLFMKEPGKYITVIIFVLTCFTFFYSRAWNKYNDHNICSRLDIMVMIFVPTCLINFRLIKRSEQIQPLYLFRVASLSFYQEPGTNIMAIIFVSADVFNIYVYLICKTSKNKKINISSRTTEKLQFK